jgi:hypothetical protein
VSPDLIFSIANAVAIVGWLLLALLPRQHRLTEAVSALAIPALLAIAYTAIVVAEFGGSPGGFSSLSDVALLFGNPWMLLAGWIHYLAFDLFIGGWEARDARERRIPHLLLLPCLALTFLFGPAGWLLYLGLRTWRRT